MGTCYFHSVTTYTLSSLAIFANEFFVFPVFLSTNGQINKMKRNKRIARNNRRTIYKTRENAREREKFQTSNKWNCPRIAIRERVRFERPMTERTGSVDPVEVEPRQYWFLAGKKYGVFRANSPFRRCCSGGGGRWGRVYWSPPPRSRPRPLVTVGSSTVESEMRQEERLSALSYGTFDSIAASR